MRRERHYAVLFSRNSTLFDGNYVTIVKIIMSDVQAISAGSVMKVSLGYVRIATSRKMNPNCSPQTMLNSEIDAYIKSKKGNKFS